MASYYGDEEVEDTRLPRLYLEVGEWVRDQEVLKCLTGGAEAVGSRASGEVFAVASFGVGGAWKQFKNSSYTSGLNRNLELGLSQECGTENKVAETWVSSTPALINATSNAEPAEKSAVSNCNKFEVAI